MDAPRQAKKEYLERYGKVPEKDDALYAVVLEQKKAELVAIAKSRCVDVRRRRRSLPQ